MGEAKNSDLRVSFDSRVKLKFLGSKVTTDAGLLAYRELDETLGLTEMGTDELTDLRLGNNKQHQLVPLLRQSVYSRLAGYEDVNDAECWRKKVIFTPFASRPMPFWSGKSSTCSLVP